MNMKKVTCFSVLVILLLVQGLADAVLNLELTKGIDSALPIAVVPFKYQGSGKSTVDVSQVITTDLQNSGQFKIFDAASIKQFPHRFNEVNFDYWRGLDLNNLVIGSMQSQGNRRYQVKFYLLNVYKGKSSSAVFDDAATILNAHNDPILISRMFVTKGGNLRHLAHQISDMIYKKLTGEQGIFSTKIAYVLVKRIKDKLAQYFLKVADADGYNPRTILKSNDPIVSPAWSPDGRYIAYVSFENLRSAIYVADLKTGKRRLLTQFSGINSAPEWSPDGKEMAVVLSKNDNPKIYVMDLKSKKLTQMTHGFSIDTEPAWSPDGQSLVFTSDRGGSPQIYQINLKTNAINRVTYFGNYNARASFTPDGRNIVLLHRNHDGFTIALQNLEAGAITVLTKENQCQSPSIAPNGRMIIYAFRKGNKRMLGLVSIDGRVRLQLPESDGEVREPVWGAEVRSQI